MYRKYVLIHAVFRKTRILSFRIFVFPLTEHGIEDAFIIQELLRIEDIKEQETIEELVLEKEENEKKKDRVSLEEIDDRLMTIDDFLN